MPENLLFLDTGNILDTSKKVLIDHELLPVDCPKPECLTVYKILFEANPTVILSADPPRDENPLETIPKYEIPAVCKRLCGIQGNRFRGFKITVEEKSGKILSTKSDHFNNL